MRMNRTAAVASALAVICSMWTGPGAAADPQIRVGVGKADITWHLGAERTGPVTSHLPELAGQDVPADPLTFSGLHSRVWAKAIVVDGPERFAFVRADILLVTGDLYESVAARVQRTTGIPPQRLLLAATHTHVANNGLFPHLVHGALYRSPDPREKEFIADGIARAVAQASESAKPATLAAGSGRVTIPAHNRRYTDPGTVPPATDSSRLDAELGVLRFDDAESGRPIAVLMNYGLHPVVLINNPYVSADFVGLAERGVESAVGAPAIWFTGAQGDQDPIFVRYSYPENEWTARFFASEAARVAASVRPEPITRASIAEKVIPLPAPGEGPPSAELVGPRTPVVGPASLLIPSSARLQAIELATASSSVALLSWPGEPIRDIGVSLKERTAELGFDNVFLFALANDWGGYWLTPDEYDRGLYERTLMFYGRESSAYVEGHVLDLADALASGDPVDHVALPPHAQADRASATALAEAEYAHRDTIVSAMTPVPDGAARAVTQPVDVVRPNPASFEWQGGSPDVLRDWIPSVRVERLTGAGPVVVATEGTGDLLLRQANASVTDSRWTATWQPLYDTPAGTYRFSVAGRRQELTGDVAFSLTSEEFEVRACACIVPGTLSVTPNSDGTVSLAVAAAYPAAEKGFRLLPERVVTGRAVVDVLSDGVPAGSVELAFVSRVEDVNRTVTVETVNSGFVDIVVTEPVEAGSFEGSWTSGGDVTFRLASVEDAFGNRA